MDIQCRERIKEEFRDCVSRTLLRLQAEATKMPFHEALLSKEAVFWSRFERSFSTSFGQSVIERVSKLVAESTYAVNVTAQKQTIFDIDQAYLNSIEHHVSQLRVKGSGIIARWEDDVREVLNTPQSGTRVQVRVISDLYFLRDGIEHFFSIKTVKPNIDQTAEAKRDLLKLKVYNPNCKTFFGLYYNPYGDQRSLYSWGPPMKIFNFHTDECVLLGRDYWDTIGGEGTYEIVIGLAQSVSIEMQDVIKQYGLRNMS